MIDTPPVPIENDVDLDTPTVPINSKVNLGNRIMSPVCRPEQEPTVAGPKPNGGSGDATGLDAKNVPGHRGRPPPEICGRGAHWTGADGGNYI